jgi:hypothetical protein
MLVLMAVFSAIPMVIDLLNKPNKDYSLWYQVGVVLRSGMDLYPDPASGRLFPFMYPPSAAALLGFLSLLGKHATTLVLVLAHSAAWMGAIGLSIWLATSEEREGGRGDGIESLMQSVRRHPLLAMVPSLCLIALIHNTYMLGQPNLALLTLVLGAFACLRHNREAAAGILVATAAAIKAFPIMVLGYFVYRRMWRATIATIAALLVWLLVVPLPFRTPAQAAADLAVWVRGMVFTYNSKGIAQRPYRSFSYKNQSIMALGHRLLRDVPADGERVLSEHVSKARQGRPVQGMGADGSLDLAIMLGAEAEAPRREDLYAGVDEVLKRAWRVNITALDFQTATAVILAAMFGLFAFVAWALPARSRRTSRTDALEFALVVLLVVMFSPLSFNYAFVWLIYPLTVALYQVQSNSASGRWRAVEFVWIGSILLIPALAIFMPLYAQACGNLFIPALLLVLGLGIRLRQVGIRGSVSPLVP